MISEGNQTGGVLVLRCFLRSFVSFFIIGEEFCRFYAFFMASLASFISFLDDIYGRTIMSDYERI